MKKKAMKQLKPGPKKISKKVWECEHGCAQTDVPCKHLEALIASGPKNSVEAIPTGKIDKFYYDSGAGYIIPKEIRDRTWEMQFRNKLLTAGLEPAKVDILVLRFIYDMTLKDITEELNFVNIKTVLRMLSDSLKYLKKIGFSRK
jgi:hypothetical protein